MTLLGFVVVGIIIIFLVIMIAQLEMRTELKNQPLGRRFLPVTTPHLTGETKLPIRATGHSAAYDFYSKESVSIPPGQKYKFTTDVKAFMYSDEVLLIFIRSSMGVKFGLQLANQTAVIDADYYNNPDNEGNIMIVLKNESDVPVNICVGDKIGQGMFINYLTTDNDREVEKGERIGGLGSTGK